MIEIKLTVQEVQILLRALLEEIRFLKEVGYRDTKTISPQIEDELHCVANLHQKLRFKLRGKNK